MQDIKSDYHNSLTCFSSLKTSFPQLFHQTLPSICILQQKRAKGTEYKSDLMQKQAERILFQVPQRQQPYKNHSLNATKKGTFKTWQVENSKTYEKRCKEKNKHSRKKMPTTHHRRNGELPLEKAQGMKYVQKEIKLIWSQRL